MSIIIPKYNEIQEELPLNPSILCIYSLPKIGKTKSLSQLPKCLILDLDVPKGARYLKHNKVEINSIDELAEVLRQLKKQKETGELDYNYIAIDTITQLEKWSIPKATQEWRKSPVYSPAKQSKYDTVLELPEGAGYYWLRKVFFSYIDFLTSFCDRVILVGHVNLKEIEKETKTVRADEIALLGKSKLGITSQADATGYMYRTEVDEKLMITFNAVGHTSTGSRCEHLRGKSFEFDWNKIYTELSNNETKEEKRMDL